MKLLICLITYNRLEYSQKTLKSLMDNWSKPHEIIIVDNASTDGTQKWIQEVSSKSGGHTGYILNQENEYPGKACNRGWTSAQFSNGKDATHFMRCDNDMEFVKDWDKKAEEYFEAIPPLGQLGLDHTALDTFTDDERYLTTIGGKTINAWPGNVGGPCIIRREVWDKGARYDETPWKDDRNSPQDMITPQEDVKFSLSMHKYGYIYGHPTEKLAWTFADASNRNVYPEYYKKTFEERGYSL